MEHLCGKDFFNTLKCLDIDTGAITSESLDWLFDNKETGAILTWLCTYVNENNVESYRESQQFNIIQNEETEISSEYIDSVFKSNELFSHLLEVNTQEINTLKKEIDNAKIKEDKINKLSSKYLSLESNLNFQIRKMEENVLNATVKHTNYVSECKNKGKQIDDLHRNIDNIAEKVHNVLSKTNNKTQNRYNFFSRMPLDSYKLNSESLITNLNLWIRKNMELNGANNTYIDINFIESELNRMKFAIEDSIINQVKSECAEKELLGRLNYLRNNNSTHISFDNQRIQEIQITSRINMLHEDLNRLYTSDLQLSAEKYTMNLINLFLIKNAEMKLNKQKDTLKILKNINNEVSHSLAQYIIVFLLLKTDKIQLQAIDKFIEDIYFYSTKYLKHYALRSDLMHGIETNVAKQKPILFDIFTLPTDKHNNEPVLNVIKQFEKQKVAIEDLENKLFVTENQKYCNTLQHLENNIKSIKDFLWCGPTMQAVIVPYTYLNSLSNTNQQIEKVNKIFSSCMDNYSTTRMKIEKNRWLKYRRLLWVLFLNNPDKLIDITESLQKFITEQAKNIN